MQSNLGSYSYYYEVPTHLVMPRAFFMGLVVPQAFYFSRTCQVVPRAFYFRRMLPVVPQAFYFRRTEKYYPGLVSLELGLRFGLGDINTSIIQYPSS